MKQFLFICALVLFTACEKDEAPKDYSAENDAEIQAYLSENNLDAKKSGTGLYYIIEDQGTGAVPQADDRVKVAYKGYFTDGTVFEENEEGISIPLNYLIRGWVEGLGYMKEGGKGTLIIPAHLAYGDEDKGDIPRGSVIIFDVELIYVNYTTENEQEIKDYLEENNIENATRAYSGLYYTIHNQGMGDKAEDNDIVTVTYTGYFIDGEEFDKSASEVTFDLANLIKGFSEGISMLNEGGNATLYIPAHLAYGNLGQGSIPPGAVLIFDVELVKIN
ncbi:FKBP-type peptidyl-prolyl cis-trans isomerase [Tamlana sp. s12]|uniref:FKBP-type peptidyl-prolyl cis-trans isomerase n=1 Tax=Tamlana sp. s12 TaxID=1630406 RepID=UPI0008397734|nr:FKBP-type peptidyl-prolyl cis-trans isomerase [Tamlana sp. s12]QQY83821.1 FKBP-type peptidyl-prolyl cis-trans isomerase [Tamlana sp. s12]